METMTLIALIVSSIGTIITATALIVAIISLKSMTKQIGRVTQTLEGITTRIEKIDLSFGGIAQTLAAITERNEYITQTLEGVTIRIEKIDLSLDGVTQTLAVITERNERISQTLEGITVRIEQIDHSLESITQRNERMISTLLVVEEKLNLSAYRDDLSGMAWKTRLRTCQRQAALHEPAYVEPRPDTPIRYVLTPAGKEFLSADLKEDIIQVLSEDASTENNMLILILGLPRLLQEAKEKDVELDVLLGIIASYADELREQNA